MKCPKAFCGSASILLRWYRNIQHNSLTQMQRGNDIISWSACGGRDQSPSLSVLTYSIMIITGFMMASNYIFLVQILLSKLAIQSWDSLSLYMSFAGNISVVSISIPLSFLGNFLSRSIFATSPKTDSRIASNPNSATFWIIPINLYHNPVQLLVCRKQWVVLASFSV